MSYPLDGQEALTSFYESLEETNPPMALIMSDDLRTAALYGLSGDRYPAYPAVMRLRERALGLPMAVSRMLDHALGDLGYSIEHVVEVQQQQKIALNNARRSRRIHTL